MKILASLFSVLLFMFCLEGMAKFYYANRNISDLRKNIIPGLVTNWPSDKKCESFAQSLITHPVLGYVGRHKKDLNSRCTENSDRINNINMTSSEDLPIRKPLGFFNVLLIGASLAQEIGFYSTHESSGKNYFEYYLNKNFISPNGKPFKIYTGAMGGWTFPNQIMMTLMYNDRVDAIVSLDGYNEARNVQDGEHLEKIWGGHNLLAQLSKNSYVFKYLNFTSQVGSLLDYPVLKNSYTLFAFYNVLSLYFSNHIISQDMVDEFSSGASEPMKEDLNFRIKWSTDKLAFYIKTLHQISKINNIYSIEFLQPSLLLEKPLSSEEKNIKEMNYVTLAGFQLIKETYRKVASAGFPVYDLTKIFRGHTETIYKDFVHYKDVEGVSIGNNILVREMANKMEILWKLKRKK